MRSSILLVLLAACAGTTKGDDDSGVGGNPCAVGTIVPGGSVELGAGVAEGGVFQAITDGQDLQVQLGSQGLWMFVLNARTRDMAVGAGDLEGIIDFSLIDSGGTEVNVQTGCRVRTFSALDDYLALDFGYALPYSPDFNAQIEGHTVTIHLELRDHEGHRAIDERHVVAHLPPPTRTLPKP